MAVTYSLVKNAVRSDEMTKGMKCKQAVVTTSTGSGGADYSSGITLTPLKLGLNVIFAVVSASAEKANGTQLSDKLFWTYDHVNTKLRFWTGASNGTTMVEETNSNNLDAGAKIRVMVLGV